MNTNNEEKIPVRCKCCDKLFFYSVTAKGMIEIKCPKCGKIQMVKIK